MLELRNINVQFSGRDILKDINETFHPGEIIGLVAPNGTGKSTLMNVIMNYVKPNSGKVVVQEKLFYTSKKDEVKIHQIVSMMPDQSDLYNHLSGREHLNIYCSMWNSDPDLIDKTIADLGMESYVKKKTGTYSLGMRQRLCFAMQIVSNTPIMLMDEVMNGLDPNNVNIISNILLKKKQEGKIIIIASHLLDNLEQIADRIFLFKDGNLINAALVTNGFGKSEISTVRVKGLTNEVSEKLTNAFPRTNVLSLSNGVSLVDVSSFSVEELSQIVVFLHDNKLTDFSFGNVTLNDLYSMYYLKDATEYSNSANIQDLQEEYLRLKQELDIVKKAMTIVARK
ncbi:ABC transporter ATP-binding protein [Ureibacillus acetophenoni]|uniref:ABC-2 type transport system ATP-binding protein n=1 Tax=Ureibacillus acetophenoni TaxID=614649 RepID=A0A285U6C0_9BACL|nr:ATP-binding cassette domain-containing protein [Ureibacillus acetophenoni]SOC37382.1 ABC-2 type transport system ATP-binding protein [Ureibacillus acetophenoni]